MRLDHSLVKRRLVETRSQAESYIKLGYVKVGNTFITKPGYLVLDSDQISLTVSEQYVSRAALKLASVTGKFGISFKGKTVLDVGSSTGGFTDYALRQGARKVIAVEVGSDQMHHSLRSDERIELHEKTDIRAFKLPIKPDIVVADVSFISLRKILPSVVKLVSNSTFILVMVKPQFEAMESNTKHKGVIKNDTIRRDILKDFETWAQSSFVIMDKADSEVSGAKGNLERFYLMRKIVSKSSPY
jgi:23S rRNA (cytidine1920-2'-O)/16S rRNA (cytidine1409-2'-O)-methyltransferase